MSTIIVRYKAKVDQADANIRAVEAVFAELKSAASEGVRYTTFLADDGVSFTHAADVDDGVDNPVPQLEAFKAFQSALGERCKEKPQPTPVRKIGSYGFPSSS